MMGRKAKNLNAVLPALGQRQVIVGSHCPDGGGKWVHCQEKGPVKPKWNVLECFRRKPGLFLTVEERNICMRLSPIGGLREVWVSLGFRRGKRTWGQTERGDTRANTSLDTLRYFISRHNQASREGRACFCFFIKFIGVTLVNTII